MVLDGGSVARGLEATLSETLPFCCAGMLFHMSMHPRLDQPNGTSGCGESRVRASEFRCVKF